MNREEKLKELYDFAKLSNTDIFNKYYCLSYSHETNELRISKYFPATKKENKHGFFLPCTEWIIHFGFLDNSDVDYINSNLYTVNFEDIEQAINNLHNKKKEDIEYVKKFLSEDV